MTSAAKAAAAKAAPADNETPGATAVADLPPDEEVAARDADTDDESTDVYTKQFLVGAPYVEGEDTFTDEFHRANAAGLVQDAINAGLRVVGDVTFVGAEPGGPLGRQNNVQSTLLTYEAPAVPAHLVGAGATEETTDVLATQADVVSPSDILSDTDEGETE